MKKKDANGTYLWAVMSKAHRAMELCALHSIANTELCFSDFGILELLLQRGPLPVNVVGSKVRLTSGSITSAIDRLEKRNLVTRKSSSDDGRSRIVHLTPEGRKLIDRAVAVHQGEMNELAAALSNSERSTLVDLLKKLGKTAAQSTPVIS